MSNDATLPGSPVPGTNSAAGVDMQALASLPARLWVILGGLRHAIAAWGGRDRAAVPLVVLAWGRVGRLAQRFAALVAHLAAGTLPPPRLRVGARTTPTAAPVRLPRGFGWLGQALPEARAFGTQLQALLEAPETAALLAACPRAGRILRPLRRMLGVPEPGAPVRAPKPSPKPRMAWWQLPPAGAAPAAPVPFPTGRPPPGWSW